MFRQFSKMRTSKKLDGAQLFFLRGRFMFFLLPFFLCSCTTTVVKHKNFRDIDLADIPMEELRLEEQNRLENLPAEQLIRMGRNHLAKGATPMARLHFLKALHKNPESTAALVGLGETFELGHEPQKARNAYALALEIDPKFVPALVGRGRLDRAEGANEKSLESLINAMGINDIDPAVLGELAITYESLGMDSLAEPLHAEVVALKPSLSFSHNNLGFNYLLQNRYDEAVASFSRALSLDPGNQRVKNNLGAAYALRGDEGRALQVFETAVDKAGAYNNLGYLYMTYGKWKEAEKALKRALELKPVYYARARENLDRLNNIRGTNGSKPQN